MSDDVDEGSAAMRGSTACPCGGASNTRGVIASLVGRKIVGVLTNALPVGRRDLAAGTKTIVLDCGHGLTFANNGSFWLDGKGEVARAIRLLRRDLERTAGEIGELLELAGQQ